MSIEINVLVHNRRIKQYHHDGKIYVEGREGSAYELEVKNNSPHRVLAVLSVDGLSVMDGNRADWNSSSGYVIDAKSSVTIPGWRLNDDDVAQFTFGGRGDAYAASKGKVAKKNIGTIGCAVFKEKELPYTWTTLSCGPGVRYGDTPFIDAFNVYGSNWQAEQIVTADSFTVSDHMTMTEPQLCGETYCSSTQPKTRKKSKKKAGTLNLGTEFGERTEHSVQTASFNKADSPTTVMEIIYSDKAGLVKMGVNLKKKTHRRYTEPSAFANKGCEPPAGWVG